MDSNVVHDVLAEVFSAGEPTSGDGPAAIFARADRIRNRQRMTGAAAAAAVAVATATVVVGSASLGAGHGSGGAGSVAVGGPGSGPATPSIGSTATATSAAPKPSTRDLSAPRSGVLPLGPPDFDVFATLTQLLPPGGSIGGTSTQPGFAGVNFTDPNGTTRIEVNVQLNATALVGPIIDCAARNLPAGARCNVVTQPDGTRWLAWDGPNQEGTTSTQQRFQQRQVDLLYPDGRRVVIGEWNAVDPKRGRVTRSTPLLTLDQLTTLATAPDWRK